MYFLYRYGPYLIKGLIIATLIGCMVWSLLPESGVDF
ncbi:hypothetical protein EC843_101574 [Buttiauxella sp. JUb87]|jgi:hypothetical protein|nr:hypothetical protein EC843_101574 [Buttiauxella sp. JUb87]